MADIAIIDATNESPAVPRKASDRCPSQPHPILDHFDGGHHDTSSIVEYVVGVSGVRDAPAADTAGIDIDGEGNMLETKPVRDIGDCGCSTGFPLDCLASTKVARRSVSFAQCCCGMRGSKACCAISFSA